MQIEYANDKISKYFNDYGLMQKKIGKDMTRAIKKQMNYLRDSDTFVVYLSLRLGKPHPLVGDKIGKYGISITANYRLIVKVQVEDLSPQSLKACKSITIEGA